MGPKSKDWLRTALLVVDMQADFASPGGAMDQGGADLCAVPAALAAAEALAAAARGANVPVIFVGLATSPTEDSPAWREWTRRQGRDCRGRGLDAVLEALRDPG